MWAGSFLLLSFLLSAPAYADCGALAEHALEAARNTFPELVGRQLDECSWSEDVVSKRKGVLIRFRPHESFDLERHHWCVSCDELEDGGWSCDHPGVTTTALLRPPDDWAEIVAPIPRVEAARLARFAFEQGRSGLAYYAPAGTSVSIGSSQLADLDYIAGGGAEDGLGPAYVLAFAIPGEDHACLQITERGDFYEILDVFRC